MRVNKRLIFLLVAFFFSSFFFAKSVFFPEKADLTVVGRVDMSDGIGKTSMELLQSLKPHLKVNFLPVRKLSKKRQKTMPRNLVKLVCNGPSQVGKVILFEEIISLESYKPYKILDEIQDKSAMRIAYSMFESSKIPEEWVRVLNAYFDAVAVPDRFLVEVYENSGVNIPIFELPLAVDFRPFLREPLKKSANKPMVFANFSVCIDRKNHLQLIRAFAQAFGNSSDVLLKINAKSSESGLNEKIKEEIRSLNLTNVEFTEQKLEAADYLKLFKTVDCYVSLSKGEGFSIQPREAMALGIPTIVTNNTAQSTICKSQLVRAIESPIAVPACYHWTARTHGVNYDCYLEEAALALKDIFYHYPNYLESKEKIVEK